MKQTASFLQMGSTPGFRWYNIALARSYLYNGQLDSCEKAIEKAAQFKELHIGTTLGQAQYNFPVNVIKLLLAKNKIERIKFQNKGWWYSFGDLSSIAALTGEAFLLKFALVNEIAENPERQQVVYNLFTSENVIGFDEILNLMKISARNILKQFINKRHQAKGELTSYVIMQLSPASLNMKIGKHAESKQTLKIFYTTPFLILPTKNYF